jgi:hypothetical protein
VSSTSDTDQAVRLDKGNQHRYEEQNSGQDLAMVGLLQRNEGREQGDNRGRD